MVEKIIQGAEVIKKFKAENNIDSQQGEGYNGNGDFRNFNFNRYLKSKIGDPPTDMVDPHAHHILFKEGNGAAQKALVKEGQAILEKYGIDPIFGLENLVWAPNRVAGQHGMAALSYVVNTLIEVEKFDGDYSDIVEALKMLGDYAAKRRKG